MRKRGLLISIIVGIAIIGLKPALASADENLPDLYWWDTEESVSEVNVTPGIVDIILGAGLGFAPDYEGSEDYDAVFLPYARANWDNGRYVELASLTFRANLVANSEWIAGPLVRYRPEREDVENDAVDALRDVDDALELGGFVGIEIGNWNVRLEAATDVTNGHEGSLITIGGGYMQPVNDQLTLAAGVSTTYATNDYMEAYFGVDLIDSLRSGLDTFDADGGFKDIGVEVSALYSIGKEWIIRGTFGYDRLLGDAEDSPIVDDVGDPNQFFGGIVAMYRF